MTAQIPDSFLFNHRQYSIAGVNGSGLFDPAAWDLHPFPTVTACWRGYICQYKLVDDWLLLHKLEISLQAQPDATPSTSLAPHLGPPINGVNPHPREAGSGILNNQYEHLELKMPFTGGLLLGADFIQELYVHMGFHPAWKYKSVFELIFSEGRLTESRDVSSQIEEIRNRMKDRPGGPDGSPHSRQEIDEWIAGTFRLDYDLGV